MRVRQKHRIWQIVDILVKCSKPRTRIIVIHSFELKDPDLCHLRFARVALWRCIRKVSCFFFSKWQLFRDLVLFPKSSRSRHFQAQLAVIWRWDAFPILILMENPSNKSLPNSTSRVSDFKSCKTPQKTNAFCT